MDTYLTRSQQLDVEIAALQADLLAEPDAWERAAIAARLASAQRSRNWYAKRLASKRRITTLEVNVAEAITTGDGLR